MLETLAEYLEKQDAPKFKSQIELIMKIGGRNSQFYAACYHIAKVMLVRASDKQRCVLIHGDPDTGKSWIANFMKNIFDSYYEDETKEMYDMHCSRNQARK